MLAELERESAVGEKAKREGKLKRIGLYIASGTFALAAIGLLLKVLLGW